MSLDIPYQAPLPILLGGTGASTLAGAQANLGIGGGGAFSVVTSEAELATAIANADPLILISTGFSLTASHTVTVDTEIREAPGVVVDMGAFQIIAVAGLSLTLSGSGRDMGNIWRFNHAVGIPGFNVSGAGAFTLDGVVIDNISAAGATPVCTTAASKNYRNTTINVPGVGGSGINIGTNASLDSVFINAAAGATFFLGGGSTGFTSFRDIAIQGSATGSYGQIGGSFGTGWVRGLDFQGSAAASIQFNLGNVHDITDQTAGGALGVVLNTPYADNIHIDGAITMTNAVIGHNLIAASITTSTGSTISNVNIFSINLGRHTQLSNYVFKSAQNINVSGDDLLIINSRVGTDGGGGVAGNFNVVAGSDRTHIVSCSTDIAITDAGTATVLANNTVY